MRRRAVVIFRQRTKCLRLDQEMLQDVALPNLGKRLRDIYEQRKDKKMFLMAAGALRYKDIIDVIDAAKGAGVDQVGIVTEGMQKAAGAGN